MALAYYAQLGKKTPRRRPSASSPESPTTTSGWTGFCRTRRDGSRTDVTSSPRSPTVASRSRCPPALLRPSSAALPGSTVAPAEWSLTSRCIAPAALDIDVSEEAARFVGCVIGSIYLLALSSMLRVILLFRPGAERDHLTRWRCLCRHGFEVSRCRRLSLEIAGAVPGG